MQDLQYPIGPWLRPETPCAAKELADWIGRIEALPSELRTAVAGLDESQLDTVYRPDGWTIRQVVHHVADSHLNCYTRFRLAMTEDEPTIRPYDEAAWAELPDAKSAPVGTSLDLLTALHDRWVRLARSLTPQDLARRFRHPEMDRPIRLDETLSLYAWHGSHHCAHVTSLRERQGW